MTVRFCAFFALILFASSAALAHGNKKHVVGTIEKINADSVIVKTTEGKSVEVKLAVTTVYIQRIEQTDKPAKVSDLAMGERVAIHATPKGETLQADEIKFSPGSAARATAAVEKKPKP